MPSSNVPQSAILLLDLPPKTFVGIDLISFNSSPNFHGIVNVPSGLHCLYTGTDATLSIRNCNWLSFKTQATVQQVYVLRWSHESEFLDLLDPSDAAATAANRSIPSLRGRGLVDYVALQDASSDMQAKQSGTNSKTTSSADIDNWPSLSRYITTQTLNRILGKPTRSTQSWTISSISSAPNDAESIPGLSDEQAAEFLHDNQGNTIGLIEINLKQTWPEGSVGRDRTDKARDRSWYLGHIIEQISEAVNDQTTGKADMISGAKDLVAELQFCFITVLTLSNYSCLEQWKRILTVLFTSKTALTESEGMYVEIVKVLRAQLERVQDVEGGLFEMSDETGSAWLRALLKNFRANVNEVFGTMEQSSKLSTELSGLEQWLQDEYGWQDETSMLRRGMVDLEDGERVEVQMEGLDEDEETGEYAPVVVDT